MPEENENPNSNNYNSNRPQGVHNNNSSTQKVVDTAAKGAATYFAPGVGGKFYDAAKKVPVFGDTINSATGMVAQAADKIPGVKKAANELDKNGVVDAANLGVDYIGNSDSQSPSSTGNVGNSVIKKSNNIANNIAVPKNNFRKNNQFNNQLRSVDDEDTAVTDTELNEQSIQDDGALNSQIYRTNDLDNYNNDNDDINVNAKSESVVSNLADSWFKKNKLKIILFGGGFAFIIIIFIVLLGGIDDEYMSTYGSYSYNSMCTSQGGGNLISFLSTWEGVAGESCSVNGLNGNKAIDYNDGTITVGMGVTNHLISSLTSYIEENNYDDYFKKNGSYYYMNVGDCIPTEVSNGLAEIGIMSIYSSAIDDAIYSLGIELTQYQKDAITSFNYNLGPGYTMDLLTAYKDGGYEGLWDEMKLYVNSQGNELAGLKSRRKGEFALFVTGDYSDKGLFYSRTLENYDNYDSEGVMSRENVCSKLDENYGLIADSSGYMHRLERPVRNNSYYYNQDVDQYAYTDYEGECSWYAGHRAKEILGLSNSSKVWSSMPNGGQYCYTSEVTSGMFTSSKNVNNPRPGALISWAQGSQYGHVAVVEDVYSDGSILISEAYISLGIYGQNARSKISGYADKKYIRKQNCEGNGSGCFQTRVIAADQITNAGWTGGYQFACYIYIN